MNTNKSRKYRKYQNYDKKHFSYLQKTQSKIIELEGVYISIRNSIDENEIKVQNIVNIIQERIKDMPQCTEDNIKQIAQLSQSEHNSYT